MTTDELLRWCFRHQVALDFDQEDEADYCRLSFRTNNDTVAKMRVWLRNHDTVVEDVADLAEAAREKYNFE